MFKALYRGTDNGSNSDYNIFEIAKENFVELYNEFLLKQVFVNKDGSAISNKNIDKINIDEIQPCNLIEAALSSDFYNDVAYGIVKNDKMYKIIVLLEHQSTSNKYMDFHELIYYVKMLIKYMEDRKIDLTKVGNYELPMPEFYVIEFNNNAKISKTVCYERVIESNENYFLRITIVHIIVYCKNVLSLVESKKNHNFSLLHYYAAFFAQNKNVQGKVYSCILQ